MKFTMGQAAKEAGVSKTTINRAIKSGRLSAQKLEDNSYRIDPAELFRVFPKESTSNRNSELPGGVTHTLPQEIKEDSFHSFQLMKLEFEITSLKQEISFWEKERAFLLGQIEDLKKDRDDWKAQAAVVQLVADMRDKKSFWNRLRSR